MSSFPIWTIFFPQLHWLNSPSFRRWLTCDLVTQQRSTRTCVCLWPLFHALGWFLDSPTESLLSIDFTGLTTPDFLHGKSHSLFFFSRNVSAILFLPLIASISMKIHACILLGTTSNLRYILRRIDYFHNSNASWVRGGKLWLASVFVKFS